METQGILVAMGGVTCGVKGFKRCTGVLGSSLESCEISQSSWDLIVGHKLLLQLEKILLLLLSVLNLPNLHQKSKGKGLFFWMVETHKDNFLAAQRLWND